MAKRDRKKRSRSRPQPPEKCLNCDTPLSGRFCTQCGQENSDSRLKVGQIAGHLMDEFLKFDLPFIKTIWQLTIRPGQVCLEYTAGYRKRYSNPFRFCLIMCAAYLYLISVFGIRYVKFLVPVGGQPITEESRTRFVELLEQLPVFAQNHLNTFIFLALPVVALVLKLFSRWSNRNFAEHYVFILFVYGQRMIFAMMLIPLAMIYDTSVMRTAVISMSLVYLTWGAKVFYRTNWIIGILKSMLIHVTLFTALFLIIILAWPLFVLLPAWLKGELG